MDNYYEIALIAQPPIDEHVEIILAYMGGFGFEGSAENDKVMLYIAESETNKENIETLVTELIERNFCKSDYTLQMVAPKNWNEEWEKNYFQPIIVGEQCLIKSSFHKTDLKAKYEIVIDPKMSFGTGHHQTTSMMVEFLLNEKINNCTILDMGTGTGILGILASQIGCKEIIGIDNDEWCYENAQENILLNNINNFKVRLGDAGLLKTYHQYFDLIIANINRHILLADIKYYVESMKPGATLLLSGFYISDLDEIAEHCKSHQLTLVEVKEKEKWVAARFLLQT